MKTYALQKRLAAHVLKIGKNRIWLDPSKLKEVGEAITKLDIRELIREGTIKKLPVAGVKRRAGKIRQIRKRKRGRRAVGRKKKVVTKRKKEYMLRIRKLRECLSDLKEKNLITNKQYRSFRSAAKAGIINTKQDIKSKLGIK